MSLVGLTTYKGQVLATDTWGGSCKPMDLRPCRDGAALCVSAPFYAMGLCVQSALPAAVLPGTSVLLRTACGSSNIFPSLGMFLLAKHLPIEGLLKSVRGILSSELIFLCDCHFSID